MPLLGRGAKLAAEEEAQWAEAEAAEAARKAAEAEALAVVQDEARNARESATAAAARISSIRLFVHEPMKTLSMGI